MDIRRLFAALLGGLALLLLAAGPAEGSAGTGAAGLVSGEQGTGWAWPLAPHPVVVARFAAPAGPYSPGHRGVDLAAAVGARVLSSGRGVVAFAGRVAGRGVVSVDHPGGLRTTYEPVTATVSRGDPVAAGTLLGVLEAVGSHCTPAACLHWGLRRGGRYLDPLSLLGPVRVRLLPVWGLDPPAAGRPAPTGQTARAVGTPIGRSPPGRRGGTTRPSPTGVLAAASVLVAGAALWVRTGQSSEGRSAASRR